MGCWVGRVGDGVFLNIFIVGYLSITKHGVNILAARPIIARALVNVRPWIALEISTKIYPCED